jgi:hypothetical protein
MVPVTQDHGQVVPVVVLTTTAAVGTRDPQDKHDVAPVVVTYVPSEQN